MLYWVFLKEVKRVLKVGGEFIVVDSYNHNIIYRINRFVHFIRGKRSFSTLKRMPNSKLLNYIKMEFSVLDIHYFGIFIFFTPLLKYFIEPLEIYKLMTYLDKKFSFLRRYSFKIVFKASK
jgi:ubiquinone/menaquinone biosynthesis C-methylase UbiE